MSRFATRDELLDDAQSARAELEALLAVLHNCPRTDSSALATYFPSASGGHCRSADRHINRRWRNDRAHGHDPPGGRCARSQKSPRNAEGPTDTNAGGPFLEMSGDDLLSRGPSTQVPSALAVLTSVFGMGTGGTPPLWSPKRYERSLSTP